MSDKSKKLNGQQKAEQNLLLFSRWVNDREAANDWNRYISKDGDKLNRTEIAAECGFGRSALGQNPQLTRELKRTEEELRKRRILRVGMEPDPASIKAESDRKQQNLGRSNSRVKALEQQVAALVAERDDLKNRIKKLEFLDFHLTSQGRFPS